MHATGLLFTILGGIMEGLFALPMRFTPRWAWENIWGTGSPAALVLVPVPLVLLTVPHIDSVYAATPASAILLAILFGAGRGLGGVFFGLGVSALGLSMGTSLIMGLIAIGGSIIPMLLQHSGQLFTREGLILLAGIAIMFVGLAVCAKAGSLRSGVQKSTNTTASSFAAGLFYCIAAGLLSVLVNFALIFGAPIAQPAIAQGLDATTANNAVWGVVFIAAHLVNFVYCIIKAVRQKTLSKYSLPATDGYWSLAVVMALLWAGGIIIYGRGASMSGTCGLIFGFPIMLLAIATLGYGTYLIQ